MEQEYVKVKRYEMDRLTGWATDSFIQKTQLIAIWYECCFMYNSDEINEQVLLYTCRHITWLVTDNETYVEKYRRMAVKV